MQNFSTEWLLERIKRRDEILKSRQEKIQKLKERCSFWHGKWAIVCLENNVLRQKIQSLEQDSK